MGMVLDVFGNMLGDSNTMFMALLVFLAAGTLAFSRHGGGARAWRGQAAHVAHHGRR